MIQIYCRNSKYNAIKKIIHSYYPSISLEYSGYSKKFVNSNQIAFSKLQEKAIYYYGDINEYVILHELNHILTNEKKEVILFSDKEWKIIIDRVKKKYNESEIPRLLYPLHIHEEFIVDSEVFKKNPLLIKPVIKDFINQAKRNRGIDLYCDFVSLSYLYKLSKSVEVKKIIGNIKKKLPNPLIDITANLILGRDAYNSYIGLLDVIDAGKIARL